MNAVVSDKSDKFTKVHVTNPKYLFVVTIIGSIPYCRKLQRKYQPCNIALLCDCESGLECKPGLLWNMCKKPEIVTQN